MTNSQHLVRDRQQNKRDETGRGNGEREDERGEVGGGESMRRKQKEGRQGKTVLPQGASSHPSEGWFGLFHDCTLVF